ncbi:glycosyltransferase [Vulcanisaeta distributa]|uniref:Glycosyl transferase family 2 n=1 Tax=Vulcanisaeta distributa (strain DSM 14429 / JCM 11212 / NBRC 100878 / IC-017) TaxID=572478 RepID=E1QTD4_VULDI|nr:glycosyltransferase [Vulcanisaeta distributa]ADN50927.1 glycosyl transferase family 2 [Vulcanisaeta distributa DSM 14429]
MPSYGLLIFNRNEVVGTLRLIKLLNNTVDEIVIIDSSDPPKYRELMDRLMKYGSKIIVFKTIPLGHVEPLRMYGLSKISTDYVLLLDTDEIPNDKLIINLRRYNEYDGYIINRYEVALRTISEQVRLFKRNKVLFRGIIHENPEILGSKAKLSNGEYIIHLAGKLNASASNYSKYIIIELFSRYPYLLNNLLINRFKRKTYYKSTTIVHVLNAILILIYFKAMSLLKPGDAEMWFSYFMDLLKIFINIPSKYRKILMNISQEIYENNGIINYLCLNNPNIVESLTGTYTWDIPGHKVFQYLILYRYKYKKCAQDFNDVLNAFHLKPHK